MPNLYKNNLKAFFRKGVLAQTDVANSQTSADLSLSTPSGRWASGQVCLSVCAPSAQVCVANQQRPQRGKVCLSALLRKPGHKQSLLFRLSLLPTPRGFNRVANPGKNYYLLPSPRGVDRVASLCPNAPVPLPRFSLLLVNKLLSVPPLTPLGRRGLGGGPGVLEVRSMRARTTVGSKYTGRGPIKNSGLRRRSNNSVNNTTNTEFGVADDLLYKLCNNTFLNLCMKEGKKNKAYKIILKTLDRLSLFGILGRVNLSLFKERLSRGSGSLVSLLRKPPIRPRRPRFAKQINRGAKIEWNEWNERSNIRMRSRLPITRSASTPVHKQSATFASKLTIRPGPEGAFGALTDSNNAAHHRKRQKHAIAPLLTPLVEGPLHIAEGTVRFVKAIENVKPTIEVRKVRISGTTQLVPSIIPNNRQKSLAIRWLIEAAIQRHNAKKSMTLDQCFFVELLEAYQNTGSVRKRRDDLHKLAESNRGFAHYRWWNR